MMGGNTANTANTGNTGNVDALGIMAGMFFPDRVDLPFVTQAPPKADPNDPLPLVEPDGTFNAGTASWLAWEILVPFLRANWQHNVFVAVPSWTTFFAHKPPNPDPNLDLDPALDSVPKEIERLVRYAEDERPDALGEILAQDDEFFTEFMNLLAMTPATHPKTLLLLHVASLAGHATALMVKAHYKRRRPSQVWPWLYPPVPMPGHSSYPSGHATQAWLMAKAVKHVLPTQGYGALGAALDRLALRIARNREIAGLHYPSDSVAGRRLAEHVWGTLQGHLPAIGEEWAAPGLTSILDACSAELRGGGA